MIQPHIPHLTVSKAKSPGTFWEPQSLARRAKLLQGKDENSCLIIGFQVLPAVDPGAAPMGIPRLPCPCSEMLSFYISISRGSWSLSCDYICSHTSLPKVSLRFLSTKRKKSQHDDCPKSGTCASEVPPAPCGPQKLAGSPLGGPQGFLDGRTSSHVADAAPRGG